MKRTISIKLIPTPIQEEALLELRDSFHKACNKIVPYTIEHRCWNRVALHHLTYYEIREYSDLGSQMVCNAIHKVASSYKALGLKKKDKVPSINYKPTSSVHFDKRTYTIKPDGLSLYTLNGRQTIAWQLGEFQKKHLQKHQPKEAELIRKGRVWYFNLVMDSPTPNKKTPEGNILGVDLGENNIATTSNGTIHGGSELRHKRDQQLALRKRLQSNGSHSAKQLLKKISGKEKRYMKWVNHCVSQKIVQEALDTHCETIAMESLTHIRSRTKGGKRLHSRLHRWAWYQLQQFI